MTVAQRAIPVAKYGVPLTFIPGSLLAFTSHF